MPENPQADIPLPETGNDTPPLPDWEVDSHYLETSTEFQPADSIPLHSFGPTTSYSIDDSSADLEYQFDPDTSYFFMFGVGGSGKSVILSGLFYNVLARRIGDQLINLNDRSVVHELRGTQLLDEMMELIPDGRWPSSTARLGAENQVFPRHMHLQFRPRDGNKPQLKFCLMDMSGEDLASIRVDSDLNSGRLNPGIGMFLNLPPQNLSFICVYPSHSDRFSHPQLSTFMINFLDELERRNIIGAPLIMIVSQWDRVAHQYESPQAFLEQKAPIVWNRLNSGERDFSVMEFSIGEVDIASGTYQYSPASSDRLFHWLYSSQTGVDLNEQTTASTWQKIMSMIKNI